MTGICDFLEYRSLSQLSLSPDEKRAAFVVQQPVLETNSYKKELWICELNNGETRRLLEDGTFLGSFFWEDEETIFYLSSRGKDTTACSLISVKTGVLRQETLLPICAEEVWKQRDGTYICRKEENLEEETFPEELSFLSDYTDGFEMVDEIPMWENGKGIISGKRSALFALKESVSGWEIRKVTEDNTSVGQVLAKPDGLYFTARTYRGRSSEAGIYYLPVQSAGSGKLFDPVCLVEESRYRIGSWDVMNAGTAAGPGEVYFTAQDKLEHCMTDDMDFYRAAGGRVEKLPIPAASTSDSVNSDCLYGENSEFAAVNGSLYYLSTEGWDSYVRKAAPDPGTGLFGQTELLTPAGGSVNGFSVFSDGSLCLIGLRGMKLQELYLCRDGELRQLTDFNGRTPASDQVIQPERFSFESDGFPVNYVVLPPANFDPEKKYPAILYIHGGAKVLYTTVFFHEMQFLASRGYYVIYGNPHGSDGQGSEFARLQGHYGEKDYEDLMKAVDVALERYPNIDKDRLGVAGGSYGGIMTNWIVCHTSRFRCAVSQRSICSMLSTFGTADNGFNFVREQMDGDLWDGMENLWRQSPLKYADQCKTPLLLIHSDEDYRCHYTEAVQMFTALKYLGVETKLCLIHGENHSLSRTGRPVQRIRRLYEIVRWFDEHLKTDEERADD